MLTPLRVIARALVVIPCTGACTHSGDDAQRARVDAGDASAADRDAAPLASSQDAAMGESDRVDLTGELGDDPLLADCPGVPAASLEPTTIEAVIAQVNELPKPLSLPCFLRALKRPLHLNLTRSIFSAQPARDEHNPRIFIFLDTLIVSVVPAGIGRHLFEMGQLINDTRSIKAEIEFPVLKPLRSEDAYEHILFTDTLTGCALCHATETETSLFGRRRVFISDALRPLPGLNVPIGDLVPAVLGCDLSVEEERCKMLRALFLYGPVKQAYFPENLATFGG